ncbi:MAG TPA: ABC transporter permease, partial [Terriglobales bacterium]|nr:ABC transporter permease [Terriglobales bacterium]
MQWSDALLRLRALLFRRQLDTELNEELQFHLEMQARKNRDRALDTAEASRQARLQFGSVERASEECREARGLGALERPLQDLRFAIRVFAKSRSTTAVLILTLALGIGANTAVFSLINGLLLRSLPVEHPEQIFFFGSDTGGGSTTGNAPTDAVDLYSYHFFQQFRNGNRDIFDRLTAMQSSQPEVRVQRPESGELPRRFTATLVDGEFFELLGVNALLGRMLTPADDVVDKPAAVTVVSYRYWSEQMGRDPQVLGKKLLINGAPFTIIGVAPPEFHGVKLNSATDFWFPLSQQSFLSERPNWLQLDNAYFLDLIGRLRPEANRRIAEATLTGQLQRMIAALEGTHVGPDRLHRAHVELVPGAEGLSVLRKHFSPRLHILTVLVLLVLTLSCLNAANLLLARGTSRRREIAVRLAVGAGRSRVIRQLLTESVLVAVLSGLCGFVLAAWAMSTFSRMAL